MRDLEAIISEYEEDIDFKCIGFKKWNFAKINKISCILIEITSTFSINGQVDV